MRELSLQELNIVSGAGLLTGCGGAIVAGAAGGAVTGVVGGAATDPLTAGLGGGLPRAAVGTVAGAAGGAVIVICTMTPTP